MLNIPNIKAILATSIDFNKSFIKSIPKIKTKDLPKIILKSDSHLPNNFFYLQLKPFKNDKKYFLKH